MLVKQNKVNRVRSTKRKLRPVVRRVSSAKKYRHYEKIKNVKKKPNLILSPNVPAQQQRQHFNYSSSGSSKNNKSNWIIQRKEVSLSFCIDPKRSRWDFVIVHLGWLRFFNLVEFFIFFNNWSELLHLDNTILYRLFPYMKTHYEACSPKYGSLFWQYP